MLLAAGGCKGSSQTQTAGIDGSGARIFAEGPIQAFGSIVLNGAHYELGSAEIRINGEVSTEQDLALGQLVVVEAHTGNAGSTLADSVAYDANLRGPVQSVDAGEGIVVVLSQRVRADADTVLDLDGGDTLDALSVGDYVEVSGFPSAEETIVATRIASAAGAGLQIIGHVDDLEIGSLRFSIGDLAVDYASAALIEGFPAGGPREGDEVIVTGAALDAGGALQADRLEWIPTGLASHEGREAEVEGLITRFVSPADFDVAGATATANGATAYEGGSASDLGLDRRIQIEGRIDAEGTIVAEKIEIKD